ncbi:MAG: glycosyltransferase [Synechococcales bacterium]|nr:glycosyltransferase [Synechococcales bacterium]
MRRPILTIFYQYDPWNASIGGIQTVIDTFIKYSSEQFCLRMVGTAASKEWKVGCWQTATLFGREVEFFPLFRSFNDNVRQLIPTSMRYMAALLKRQLASDFMHFHRLEPTLSVMNWPGEKTLFVHNDIQKQISRGGEGGTGILWQRFPEAYLTLEKVLLNQFDQILSCNASSTLFYLSRYPKLAQRIKNVKNAIDDQLFYPLPAHQKVEKRLEILSNLGLSPETKLVLFAGRLHPQKNPLLLVQSIAALSDPQIHLLLAGAGELESAVRAEVQKLHLERQVTLLGAVPRQDLAELQRIADVFVLTSDYEGLPMVALEALASGTPLVTTPCEQVEALLSPTSGVVCRERTPARVADAILRVLKHPEQFPSSACLASAAPYQAQEVIRGVYDAMWSRWQQKQQQL